MLQTFNKQLEKREELRAQISKFQSEINDLEKQLQALCVDAITEGDVMCDALDAAGFVYELERPSYNQTKKPYTITRIVRIEGFPVLCELDRNTGILLMDGKAAGQYQILLPA